MAAASVPCNFFFSTSTAAKCWIAPRAAPLTVQSRSKATSAAAQPTWFIGGTRYRVTPTVFFRLQPQFPGTVLPKQIAVPDVAPYHLNRSMARLGSCRTIGRPSHRPPSKPEIKRTSQSRVETQGRFTSRLPCVANILLTNPTESEGIRRNRTVRDTW
jgi:hypothetical protein